MTDIMQSLFFILIFTCPGFLIQNFLRYIKKTSYPEITDFDKNIWAVFYSFLVLIVNSVILTALNSKIKSIQDIISCLDNLEFLLKYVMLTLISSVLVAFVLWIIFFKILFLIESKYNQSKYKLKLLPYPTVWENIRNLKVDVISNLNDMCVEVIKNGNVVTQGSIECFSNPSIAKKDFLLTDVEAVRIYLENDKGTSDEFKMFPKILYEYYDAELDVLIRFYDNSNWIKAFGKH